TTYFLHIPMRQSLYPYTTLFRSPDGLSLALSAPQHRSFRNPDPGSTRHEPNTIQRTPRGKPTIRQRTRTHPGRQKSRPTSPNTRSEEHTSELQSRFDLVCRLLLE